MSVPSYAEARRSADEGRPLGSMDRLLQHGARSAEDRRRNVAARARAVRALSWAYPDTYAAFVDAARAEIDDERGPLPADDPTT